MRGLSALLIVIAHLPDINNHAITPEDNPWYLYIRSISWIGVDVFFVLSGFLVSGTLFADIKKNGYMQIKLFYLKRLLRITPPFYALIFFTIIFKEMLPNIPPLKYSQIFGELFFIQNYFDSIYGITWSLGVEEHFYLFIPFVFKALHYKKISIGKSLLFLILFFQLIRFIGWMMECSEYSLYTHSHFRFDALLIGCLASWIHHYKPEILKDKYYIYFYIILIPILIGWLSLGRTHPIMAIFGYSLIPFIVSFWLLYNINKPRSVPKSVATILTGLGKISYSLYLWHLPVQYFTLYTLFLSVKFNEIEYCFIYITLSIATATAIYYLVEKPSFRVRAKIIKLLKNATIL